MPTLARAGPRPRRYRTIEHLAAALKKRGLVCTNLEYLDQPDPTLAEFALCDMGGPSRRIDIYRYASATRRDQWLPGMIGVVDLVYGPNWIITVVGDPATAPERAALIAEAIGGRVLPKSG